MSRIEKRVLIALFYSLLICGGIFTIYLIHCKLYMYIKDYAVSAASELSTKSEVTDYEEYLPCSIFLYQESDNSIHTVHQYRGQNDIDFTQFISSYIGTTNKKKSFYSVPGRIFPFQCVALAGAPVFKGDIFIGEVYVCYYIQYLLPICVVFFIIATLLFTTIAATLIRVSASGKQVERIYHAYIANISHELKTPIASILALTEILNEQMEPDEVSRSRYYGIMTTEARQLEHSVLQIIELSKLQDGRITYNKSYVNVHDIFDPILTLFSNRCEELGIAFSIEQSVWELPDFYTDPLRLSQIINILLDNAYKFVDEGGRIWIDATRRHGRATLRVNDNGRGISEDDIPYIFDRFYKTAVDNPTGSGLGLSIAREIAEGLNEHIWVSSKESEYTIFFITVQTV